MSDFDIILRVSNGLRSNILSGLANIADFNIPRRDSVERISSGPPDGASGAEIIASLYLYRVDILPHLRQRPAEPLNDRSSMPSPTPLRLHYLFTPCGASEAINQLMLGRSLQYFSDFPVFQLTEGSQGGSEAGVSQCRLTVDTLSTEQLAQLFTAFCTPYRTALPLFVDGISMDSRVP